MSWYAERPVAATANSPYRKISTRPQPERRSGGAAFSGTAAPQGVEAEQQEGHEQTGDDHHARARAAGLAARPPGRHRRDGDQAEEVQDEHDLVDVGRRVREPHDAV